MSKIKSFRYLNCIFFFTFFFLSHPLSAANVVQYYNDIPLYLGGESYQIKFIHNKWKATRFSASEPAVTVDINNGYILIEDRGTGGGVLTTEIAMFKSKRGQIYLVLSTKLMQGVPILEYTVKVLEKNRTEWNEVTETALPNINIQDFLTGKPINHHVIRSMKKSNVMDYVLPRVGTEIKINLNIAWIDYFLTIQDTPADIRNAYLQFKKQAVYKTICLKWDSVRAKFVFARKIPA